MRLGTALSLQAETNTCVSGGGIWDSVTNVCVEPGVTMPVANSADIYGTSAVTPTTQIIPGVDNTMLYIAGAIILYFLFRGHR